MGVIRAATATIGVVVLAACGLLDQNLTAGDVEDAFMGRGMRTQGANVPEELFVAAPIEDARFLDVIGTYGVKQQRAAREEFYVVIAGSSGDAEKIAAAWSRIGTTPQLGGATADTDYVADDWQPAWIRSKNVVLLYQVASEVTGQTRLPQATAAMNDLTNG